MRKIFLFMMTSLDGYFEGENHDLSWHHVDGEFNQFAIQQTSKVDILLFGRRTYELMLDFWSTEQARLMDPETAKLMNNTLKIVFSHTLEKVEETQYWKNVKLVRENIEDEIRKLKSQPGKDLAVFGSNNFCVSLIEMGLLDEARIMVNPVAIGNGTPLFKGINKKLELKFIKTKVFKNGNVLLYYNVRN